MELSSMVRNRAVVLAAAAGAALLFSPIVFAQPNYEACGTLFQGVECVLFEDINGLVLVLDNLGGFDVGDQVYVIGTIDLNCGTICQQDDGCVFSNTITDCVIDPPPFIRGDVDANGMVNSLVDTLYLLVWGFQGGPEPPCLDAADFNDDGMVNPLTDGLIILCFGFQGCGPPPPPFPDCGFDPTDDTLTCDSYTCP